jgi:hypothetical protein
MGRARCDKPEHADLGRNREGRCRGCVTEAGRRYRQRTREAYRSLREQVEGNQQ